MTKFFATLLTTTLIYFAVFSYVKAETYTYDKLNRLVRVDYPNSTSQQFFYDELGNRTGTIVSELRTITTGAFSGNYCRGSQINVSFTIIGVYNQGNIFSAQLSNSSGNFSSPTVIGTLSGTSSGVISAMIPSNATFGSGYRIRVVSSSPVVTGTDNGSNLQINNCNCELSVGNVLLDQNSSQYTGRAYSKLTVAGTAGNFILSGNGSVGGKAVFLSSASIVIKPGFRAQRGAKVRVKIDANPCNTSIMLREPVADDTIETIQLSNQLTIYPNPNDGSFNLKLSKENPLSIVILNSIGEKIISVIKPKESNLSFDISNYPSGVYLILAQYEDEVQSVRIMVIR